jgi:hypothetical protein
MQAKIKQANDHLEKVVAKYNGTSVGKKLKALMKMQQDLHDTYHEFESVVSFLDRLEEIKAFRTKYTNKPEIACRDPDYATYTALIGHIKLSLLFSSELPK